MKKIIFAVAPFLLLAVLILPAFTAGKTETTPKAGAPSAPAPAAAAAPAKPAGKPADEWKARGKKGADRLAALANAKKAGSLKAEEACELTIETAYAMFNDPKSLDKVKKSSGGVDTYSLLVPGKDQAITQISFFYPSNMNQLVAITAFQLGKGWNFSASNPSSATLEGEGCRYRFDFTAPLSPKITAFK